MSENTYMIVYDVSDERLDLRSLQGNIKDDPIFLHWWNHLPSLFLVETKLHAVELTKTVRAWLGDVSFIVMQVDTCDASGWLPEEAAAWVRRRRKAGRVNERAVQQAS